jgi:hypothetical protein
LQRLHLPVDFDDSTGVLDVSVSPRCICRSLDRFDCQSSVLPLNSPASTGSKVQSSDAINLMPRLAASAWSSANSSAAVRLSSIECLRKALAVAPDYTDDVFNLALLLQRQGSYAQAEDHWRQYLASDGASEWAGRARRYRHKPAGERRAPPRSTTMRSTRRAWIKPEIPDALTHRVSRSRNSPLPRQGPPCQSVKARGIAAVRCLTARYAGKGPRGHESRRY